MENKSYTVELSDKTVRLDTFISLKSGLTRSSVQKLIRDGAVLVNSSNEKAGYHVRHGDNIDMTLPEETETSLVPEDLPIDVLFEDEHIIAVNKPPGMVIYPAAGHSSGTLMNAIAFRCKKLASVGMPLRPGVVHRLDKETSGLIIIAKDDDAYYSLVNQFKQKEVEKEYVALVYGTPKRSSGEINAEIGRSTSDRKKMSTRTKRGKEAVTQYKVINDLNAASLVKVRIITGRTHQIRVHFASSGHPVLGDKTYGKKTAIKFRQKAIQFKRQMLHSHILKFKHPATGEAIKLTAPVPEDIKKAIEELSEETRK
jgi:23S rRNA pseudouridine1911/1915/1917 synthase